MSLILDGATPMLQELVMVSRGYAVDALNHSSIKLQQAMQSKARSYGQSKFGVNFKPGRRQLAGTKQEGLKRNLFGRNSHADGSKQHDLANFIKFQTSSVTLKSMVGFINFKGYSADIYRNGKKVRSKFVKGQGREAKDPMSENIKEIGQNMEFGGKKTLTKKQKGLFRASGWGAAANRGYVMRKARPVVNPVFASMRGSIHGIIEEKYGKALAKHAAEMNTLRKIG